MTEPPNKHEAVIAAVALSLFLVLWILALILGNV